MLNNNFQKKTQEKVLCAMSFSYHSKNFCIKFVCIQKFLKGEVHAIAPIVLRIGRNVDALGIRICKTELLRASEPVLNGYDAECRRTVEMALHHVGGKPLWHRMRSRAAMSKHCVVELLSERPILVPPHSHRSRVVA